MQQRRGRRSGVNSKSKRRFKKKDMVPVKGPWGKPEDSLLIKLVKEHGPKDWSVIASAMAMQNHYRLGKQCRERWFNHLSPEVRKDPWSSEEDELIYDGHRELGNKWTALSKLLKERGYKGRPANAIKNHWNSTLKKRISQRERSSRSHAVKSVLSPIHSVQNVPQTSVPSKKRNRFGEPKISTYRHSSIQPIRAKNNPKTTIEPLSNADMPAHIEILRKIQPLSVHDIRGPLSDPRPTKVPKLAYSDSPTRSSPLFMVDNRHSLQETRKSNHTQPLNTTRVFGSHSMPDQNPPISFYNDQFGIPDSPIDSPSLDLLDDYNEYIIGSKEEDFHFSELEEESPFLSDFANTVPEYGFNCSGHEISDDWLKTPWYEV